MIGSIVSYGVYVPRYRLLVEDIARAHGHELGKIQGSLQTKQKAVAAADEDCITIAVQAAKNALQRMAITPDKLKALYVGSESHPYAVKPSAAIIGDALGVNHQYAAADVEFACKGGTAALQIALATACQMDGQYALAVGSDIAQAKPTDILEYTAAAGGAAFVVGKSVHDALAIVEYATSFTSDTPDFWRRSLQPYPQHTGRFTGGPSYFYHITKAVEKALADFGITKQYIDYVVFHQPNAVFPISMAKYLGFTQEQYGKGLLVASIGNTYSANSLLGLAAVLDSVDANKYILVASYGSGSGSDVFIIKTTDKIAYNRKNAMTIAHYMQRSKSISYATYRSYKKCDNQDSLI